MRYTLSYLSDCTSLLCAVHCLLLPILILISPAWLLFGHSLFEQILILSAILTSLLSLCWGYSVHRSFKAVAFFYVAVFWLGLALINHYWLYSLFGGICLILANYINRRMCKSCTQCKENCHDKKPWQLNPIYIR